MASIPAIVDATTWDTLNLHPGAIFNLYKNTATGLPTRYIAVARVQQFSALDNAIGGKIMVDYSESCVGHCCDKPGPCTCPCQSHLAPHKEQFGKSGKRAYCSHYITLAA